MQGFQPLRPATLTGLIGTFLLAVGTGLFPAAAQINLNDEPASPPAAGQPGDAASLFQLQQGQVQLQTGLKQLQEGTEKLGEGVKELGANLKITTVDKNWGIGVFGSLNGEMLFAERRVFLPSAPIFVFPNNGRETPTFEAHAKSTNLGLALQGPEFCGLKAGGLFTTYLYGEQFEADRYGFFIPRAWGELRNDQARFAAGLEGDVMNPLSPTMLNFNAGNAGGNFGFFRGQFRFERYLHLHDQAQITTQLALADPVSTSFAEFDRPPNNFLEDNGWPHLQGRIALALGCLEGEPGREYRPFEAGISGILGELRRTDFPGPNQTLDVEAFGADLRWQIVRGFGIKGEYFSGQAIGNYNAAILQVDNDLFQPVHSTGGWGEVFFYLRENLHTHLGYGIDNPRDADLSPGRPSRNQFAFGNLIWDVHKNVELGFELSRLETSYIDVGPLDLDASSWMYHTRVRFKF